MRSGPRSPIIWGMPPDENPARLPNVPGWPGERRSVEFFGKQTGSRLARADSFGDGAVAVPMKRPAGSRWSRSRGSGL